MIECSLCPQTFDEEDELIDIIIGRHEDHHDQSKPKGSMNQTFGKVEWYTVD
jgi:hypothetical protein